MLGYRAKQIMQKSPIYTKPTTKMSCMQIAEKELREGLLPFVLWRVLPDGSCEEWHLNELEILGE